MDKQQTCHPLMDKQADILIDKQIYLVMDKQADILTNNRHFDRQRSCDGQTSRHFDKQTDLMVDKQARHFDKQQTF